jgi:hypothetical protein
MGVWAVKKEGFINFAQTPFHKISHSVFVAISRVSYIRRV